MFLTDSGVAELTGLVQPKDQERWLRECGLNVRRNRNNRVVITWEVVNRWMLGEKPAKSVPEPVLNLDLRGAR